MSNPVMLGHCGRYGPLTAGTQLKCLGCSPGSGPVAMVTMPDPLDPYTLSFLGLSALLVPQQLRIFKFPGTVHNGDFHGMHCDMIIDRPPVTNNNWTLGSLFGQSTSLYRSQHYCASHIIILLNCLTPPNNPPYSIVSTALINSLSAK